MTDTLTTVGIRFRLPGEFYSYKIIKNGNINSTYKVTYNLPNGDLKSYIFQKINTYVFKDPVGIMENIDRVTTHIREKEGGGVKLHFHHTDSGTNYVFDDDGSFWRVMNFVDSVTFDTSRDLRVVRSTGRAFGRLQNELSDFDGSLLHETIPNFHNTRARLDTLFAHVEEDPVGKVAKVRAELDYIASVRARACELCDRYERGEFPIRVTHNDTKSNNVLFDRKTLEPLVVIDLDTVMPGMAMYDFGDAVRFGANTSVEDESDLSKVSLDTDKFRAFCEGYIGEVKDSLTPAEIDSMVLGAFSITIELASRFLDDYITGDKYFKTLYPKHNLVRTRCQLELARDIDRKFDELRAIVAECCK